MNAILRQINGSPVQEVIAKDIGSPSTSDGVEACFHINGRFLTQAVTGVQRYAHQIVQGLDRHPSARRFGIELVAPSDARSFELKTMKILRTRGLGCIWDQTIFPARRTAGLINLCNVGPITRRNAAVCIHDCNVFLVPDSYGRSFRAYYQLLLPLLAKRSTRLVTVSNHAATSMAALFGIPSSSIDVLPNGFEHALEWDPTLSSFHGTGDGDRPFVLVIGSLVKHKNVRRVIDLADKLAEMGLDLKVVGGGGRIYASTTFADHPNVKWLGRVTDHDLAWLLDRAMCLAFPSTCEGFGLPVLEAMARGCPVVTSNRSSLPEVCGDAALYADPDSGNDWASAFSTLAKSKALRAELSQSGLLRSRMFSWTRSVEGYLDIMADAL